MWWWTTRLCLGWVAGAWEQVRTACREISSEISVSPFSCCMVFWAAVLVFSDMVEDSYVAGDMIYRLDYTTPRGVKTTIDSLNPTLLEVQRTEWTSCDRYCGGGQQPGSTMERADQGNVSGFANLSEGESECKLWDELWVLVSYSQSSPPRYQDLREVSLHYSSFFCCSLWFSRGFTWTYWT